MSKREVSTVDLTAEEQEHVRTALVFLHAKFGGWRNVAKTLRFEQKFLADIVRRRRNVSASLAFRLARLVAIGVDDLVAGRWPEPGTCPKCGFKPPKLIDGRESSDALQSSRSK